jgi:hypothetical protein
LDKADKAKGPLWTFRTHVNKRAGNKNGKNYNKMLEVFLTIVTGFP